ncbi:unnamed protein product [Spirodela intermedia]|uniref:tRNA N(3)-methylcytidine methyltransferase n=1 Tax=Spirodela intermedia TaxID=51605 RepID=A0A7I8K2U7_SPIIN|nr:unnamed protein product [Spirodela intermedia]
MAGGGAGKYHAKDFDWEDLREEVEKDPSKGYHVAAPSSSGYRGDLLPSSLPHASEAWRSFHKRHSTGRFFKERRYLLKEFPELAAQGLSCCALEVGCGNGSTALPILRAGEGIVIYACDCSPDALEVAKATVENADDIPRKDRFRAFLLDFSLCGFPRWLFCDSCQASSIRSPTNCSSDVKGDLYTTDHSPYLEGRCCIGGVDFVTLVFTLSAVPFQRMPFTLAECISVLKPGGLLLFRDYGLYDMTMLRFPPEQRAGFREYTRSDGTLSYFFSLDIVRRLFCGAGFIELELEYCCVRSENRRNGKIMRRVWVHGKFQKPR